MTSLQRTFLIIMFLLGGFSYLYADGTLRHITGDIDDTDRINLVFVAEAYTRNEEQKFSDTVESITKKMFSTPFYREYAEFFNVWQIFVPSNESGTTIGSKTSDKDTYFKSALSGNVYRFNQSKVYELVSEHIPDYDQIILLVNDKYYGGCSYGTIVVLTANIDQAKKIILHELGHGFANLADEYDFEYSIEATEMRNVTAETERELIRWKDWILPETPLPTPEKVNLAEYDSVIGIYEGAMYKATGWYRPKEYCMMQSTTFPFCEICIEAHAVQLYSMISPVKRKSPDDSVLNDPADTTVFSVATRTPHPNTQTIDWLLDGKKVHSGSQLSLKELSPASNSFRISAIVSDTTPLVRNPFILDIPAEAGNVLNDTITWQINHGTDISKHISRLPVAGTLSACIAKGRLTVNGLQNSARPFEIAIFTPEGKSVFSKKLIFPQQAMSSVSFPLTNISNGLYIIKLYDEYSSIHHTIEVLCTK